MTWAFPLMFIKERQKKEKKNISSLILLQSCRIGCAKAKNSFDFFKNKSESFQNIFGNNQGFPDFCNILRFKKLFIQNGCTFIFMYILSNI